MDSFSEESSQQTNGFTIIQETRAYWISFWGSEPTPNHESLPFF